MRLFRHQTVAKAATFFHTKRSFIMSRMPKERMDKALEQLKTISPEDHQKVKGLTNIVRPLRSFIFKTPDD